MGDIRIESYKEDKIKIFTPYNPDFVKRIKKIGGAVWKGDGWVVSESFTDDVRKIMLDVYGYSDVTDNDTVTLRVTVHEELRERCGSVFLFGKNLSKAYGRDSGAKPGEDVAYLEGGCTSGGSAKNWCSVVQENSVIKLYNVNRNVYEVEIDNLPDGVSVEIIDNPKEDEDKVKLIVEIAGSSEDVKSHVEQALKDAGFTVKNIFAV